MPDIVYPNTISAGATTAASAVAENLFRPRFTPDSLEVVNRLDKTNFSGGGQFITRAMVRPGQHLVGGTSGHTANRDYFKQMFPDGWLSTTMSEAAAASVPVAGLCRTQRIDFVPSLFHVSWQFSSIIDDGNVFDENSDYTWIFSPVGGSGTAGHRTSIHLYVNGVQIDTHNYHLGHSERTLAQRDAAAAPALDRNTSKAFYQDSRYIFGHAQFDSQNVGNYSFVAGDTPLRAGLHTVELRVASKKRLVRFKTSNISIVAMR